MTARCARPSRCWARRGQSWAQRALTQTGWDIVSSRHVIHTDFSQCTRWISPGSYLMLFPWACLTTHEETRWGGLGGCVRLARQCHYAWVPWDRFLNVSLAISFPGCKRFHQFGPISLSLRYVATSLRPSYPQLFVFAKPPHLNLPVQMVMSRQFWPWNAHCSRL